MTLSGPRSITGRAACLAMFVVSTTALAAPLRIVTYNIEADIGGFTTPRPGLDTVLQGIGNETVIGTTRPIDILTLQETTSNTETVDPIVTSLNNLYGAGRYSRSPYQATTTDPSLDGNGPNAVVYCNVTLQLIASVGVGTPSGSGAPRQPVRYQFRPNGGTSANDFYVYCSHFKSGTTTTDSNRRNAEAQLLRTDEATLPATARVLYTGDFNDDNTDAYYATLTASGQGQAFDPLNVSDWTTNNGGILTQASTSVRYRDDIHFITQNVLNDATGLKWIAGSYHTFGNNGSIPKFASVTSGSNTALTGLPNRSAVLSALTTASDHLPMVADYNTTLTAATIVLNPATLDRTVSVGHSLPNETFTVTDGGQIPLWYAITPSAAWLTVNPTTGSSTGEADIITIMYSTAALSPGTYTANITVADPQAANTPQNLAVTLHVTAGNGDFDADSDVDQSDFAHLQLCFSTDAQPIAPGCGNADMNSDTVISPEDAGVFVNCMAGPNHSPGC